MLVKIVRVETSAGGVFGVMSVEGEAFCVTLEPQDLGNRRWVSCIPNGVYLARRVESPKYGSTFEVDIPDRSKILFHAGNVVQNTAGCILVGQYFGKLKGDRAVMNSGYTFEAFMRRMIGRKAFALEVVTA